MTTTREPQQAQQPAKSPRKARLTHRPCGQVRSMPWIVWVLVGAVSLRVGVGLLVLWDRRPGATRRTPDAAR